MQDNNLGKHLDQAGAEQSTFSAASIYPTDSSSADSYRVALKSFEDKSANAVKNLFDRDSDFKLQETGSAHTGDPKNLKGLADGIVQLASAADGAAAGQQTDDRKKDTAKAPTGAPTDKKDDPSAKDKPVDNNKKSDVPAKDKPVDNTKKDDATPKEERVTVNQGSIADMIRPKGFNAVDQKKVDEEFGKDDANKFTVLQHQDKDKQDARIVLEKFGYYAQQPETVKAFNDFLNSVKKEDLGKPITLTDKQMDQLYPALPNGIDPRPQEDHKFSVREIDGRRVLFTESKILGPDGDSKNEKMKLTVYANPNEKNSTMDIMSFEASSQDKNNTPGSSNYAALKPEALKAIRSITWTKSQSPPNPKSK